MTDHRIKDALEPVCASPALKARTKAVLEQRARQKRAVPHRMVWSALAACLLLGFGGWSFWMQPVTYISIDINPSIELSLNRSNKVVQAKAFGQEGAEVLAGTKLRGRSLEEAVVLLLEREKQAGYLGQEALISFTVQSTDLNKERAVFEQLQQCADQIAPVQVECHTAAPELWAAAHQHGLSAGKYQAILEIAELDSDPDIEGYRHYSMRELRELAQKAVPADDGREMPEDRTQEALESQTRRTPGHRTQETPKDQNQEPAIVVEEQSETTPGHHHAGQNEREKQAGRPEGRHNEGKGQNNGRK